MNGSNQIIRVANELNIKNIVYVSSANTVGYGTEQVASNETFSIEYPFSKSFYAQSKMEAEKLFVEASLLSNNHIIIINPTFMIGAYDTKPSSGKLLIMGYKRWMMFVPKGGKNFVPVIDVSNAVCNALTQGRSGARYLTSGKNLSFREFYELQMRVEGYQQLIIEVPNFIIKAVGKIGDLLRKIGIKTDISTMNLNQLTIREYYSNKKAKDELNFTESDLEVAVLEAIDWFKLNIML